MNIEFMKIAIQEAEQSGKDIPIGAVIVRDGEIIASSHNLKEERNDVSAHAEILVLKDAAKVLDNWRLAGCDLYVTLEPCPMCAWAIMNSRIDNLYFGSYDTVYGAFSVIPQLQKIANSKLKVKGGIMEQECDELLKTYFEKLRVRERINGH